MSSSSARACATGLERDPGWTLTSAPVSSPSSPRATSHNPEETHTHTVGLPLVERLRDTVYPVRSWRTSRGRKPTHQRSRIHTLTCGHCLSLPYLRGFLRVVPATLHHQRKSTFPLPPVRASLHRQQVHLAWVTPERSTRHEEEPCFSSCQTESPREQTQPSLRPRYLLPKQSVPKYHPFSTHHGR